MEPITILYLMGGGVGCLLLAHIIGAPERKRKEEERKRIQIEQQKIYQEQRVKLVQQCWDSICNLEKLNNLGFEQGFSVITLFIKTKGVKVIKSKNELLVFDNNELNNISISKYQEYILSKNIIDKNKKEDAIKMLNFDVWKGMSYEQLVSMKDFGNKFVYNFLQYSSLSKPTDIERSNKGEDNYMTVVYGTKHSGSYYKFKNGELYDWVEREGS
jgi:hypothetical protein